MAIDPTQVTTVQVSELPPNPISSTDNFAHEVGDILSRATIAELVAFIRGESSANPYEIKYIRIPNSQYVIDNFNMTVGATQGLGLSAGLWSGWAVCNGNNGTDNLDGQVLMGYGATHLTVGQFLGASTHTLTASELPPLPKLPNYRVDSDRGENPSVFSIDEFVSFGGGQPHNNIQPSMVVLIIMKLP